MKELRKKIKDCDVRKEKISTKWNQKRNALEDQITQCYDNAARIDKEIKKSHKLEAFELGEVDKVRSEFKRKLKPFLPPPTPEEIEERERSREGKRMGSHFIEDEDGIFANSDEETRESHFVK